MISEQKVIALLCELVTDEIPVRKLLKILFNIQGPSYNNQHIYDLCREFTEKYLDELDLQDD
jgi:hypothetical protein